MAQRKSAPSSSPRSRGPSRAPTAKAGTAPKAAGTKAPGTKAPATKAPATKAPPTKTGARPPVKKKPGKSIVNQKQTPWGLIITTVLIVAFAVGIVTFAVWPNHKSSGSSSKNPYTQPEIAAAKQIRGMKYKVEPDHNHDTSPVKYDTTPPTGGNHSQIVADCTGTVYPKAIANENAVHMLEHGAVWITYKPGLAGDQVASLAKLVNGVDHTAMSPYPGLKTNISLQAWNYQLFVDNASDPRIQQFIGAFRANPKTTPEAGASCADAAFKAKPSTFGHPVF